jgi:hypothetical protein
MAGRDAHDFFWLPIVHRLFSIKFERIPYCQLHLYFLYRQRIVRFHNCGNSIKALQNPQMRLHDANRLASAAGIR